jgi:phosphoglycolate phosphatase
MLDRELHDDRAALQHRINMYRTIYLDEGTPLLKPFAGTDEVLRQLHAEGIKCLIISNKGVAAIRRSLDESRLTPFIETVLGDEPGVPRKPDPAMMTDHILPRYAHLQRDQILIVGDTEADILFAKRSGLPCCWASYGYGEKDRCRALEPQHEISRIEELPPIVRRG